MGNKYSLGLSLDGENPDGSPRAIIAGSSLRGTVVLDVYKKMKPGTIDIQIIGAEHTVVSKRGRSTRQDHCVLNGKITIPTSNQREQKRGRYKFPFSFELPESLPSSFQYPSQGRSFSAKIEYVLSIAVGKEKIVVYVPVVSAPLPNVVVPSQVKPSTHKLKSCGLIDQGIISVGASVTNSLVGRGENLIMSIVSKNNTSVRIERVRVKLVEVVEYRAINEQQTHEITLEKYKDVSLPNVDRNRQSRRHAKWNAQKYNEEEAHREIEEAMSSEENRLLLKVPISAADSVGGTLITTSHFVEITFLTRGMTKPITKKIPVSIGTPPLASSTGASPRRCYDGHSAIPCTLEPVHSEEEYHIDVNDPGLHVLECDDIPLAEAVVLGSDDTSDSSGDGTPRPSAPSETFLFQNDSIYLDHRISIESNRSSDSLSLGQHALPSMSRLIYELDGPSNEVEVITAMLTNQDWIYFFEELSPREIGRVIHRVDTGHQIDVASLLFASSTYSCLHCAAVIKHTSEYLRPTMIEKILPFCVDLASNYQVIQEVLSEWEVRRTARTFEHALQSVL